MIDDDPATGAIVLSLIDRTQAEVEEARTAGDGWARLERSPPDVLVLDNILPDGRGLDLLARVRQLDPRLPILFVTAEGTSGNAIEAMKLGAFDFLAKPIDLDRFERQLAAAIEHRRLMRAPVELSPEGTAEGEALVGRCPAMQEVFRSIGRLARQDVPALLVGETGVGKELVARAIYQHGDRAGRLFLKVNCADHSQERLEIELFGEEDPARDDGTALHVGKLEQCDGGTLLIEEVAALAPATQSKLLRFLRAGVFERVGGTRTIESNVRLTFTTADEPAASLRQGRLREDLYYALSAYALRIPPLRERGDDLRLLTERFVARFSNFGRGIVGELPRVSPEAYELLSGYDWPGNVSELQAVLRRALIESKGAVLATDFLRDLVASREIAAPGNEPGAAAIAAMPPPDSSPAASATAVTDWKRFIEYRLNAGSEDIYAEAIEEMERHALTIVLTHTGGNQAKAAKALGMTRTSLRKKVLALRIRVGSFVASSDETE
ncbi:MAG TPA: sigma-54 dependent transcriptional regulator [Pirellulaceae bacterium]|nr:sigma-54 dependent transcriptional regulator [Pirellulaceae bacterium]